MFGFKITLLGFSVIFFATTLGAATVFFFKNKISDRLGAAFFGFAAGIMIAASVWSLLLPSIEGAAGYGIFSFIPASAGFVLGGLFITILDRVVPEIKLKTRGEIKSLDTTDKAMKLFLAITAHNIPEGLAVGFAFGGAAALAEKAAYFSALGLAIGIAVQNFPEGAAVSLPFKSVTGNNFKAFLLGVGSGAVEPVAATAGYFLATVLSVFQPWLLSFAAGAMIFVAVEDLIPDSVENGKSLGVWGVMAGFTIMMALDVALG